MTSKELLYVEDALAHEAFLKKGCKESSYQLQDKTLANYLNELEQNHNELFNKFLNLL